MTVYYKMRQMLLQHATCVLLRNATEVYYKMRQVFYFKMQQLYYKMRRFITKCDSYYKMRRLLLIATLQESQLRNKEREIWWSFGLKINLSL